jgi:predicted glycoside hydrolase/deacetylase ChbG (UPF0249 family)
MRQFRFIASGLLTLWLMGGILVAAEKRYVIIHADDAGMSHSVNRATINAMEHGVVSSASTMVPCPWFPEFAKYAKANPTKDFGVHLSLNSEWEDYRWGPVADRSKVPSLVDEHGYLWDNVQQVAENAKVEEAEIELRAQIDRAIKFGVPLSHLDTHMGAVLARPDLAKLYVKLGLEYKLPVLFVRPSKFNNIAKEYPDAVKMVPTLEGKGMPLLDELYQFYDHGPYEQRKQIYLKTLRELRPGVSQIIIHCGYDDSELQHITSSAPIRDTDRQVFMDPTVIAEIKKLGIEVIGWKQFQALRKPQGK